MTNQLITHRVPIDYSLMSLMLSIRWIYLDKMEPAKANRTEIGQGDLQISPL